MSWYKMLSKSAEAMKMFLNGISLFVLSILSLIYNSDAVKKKQAKKNKTKKKVKVKKKKKVAKKKVKKKKTKSKKTSAKSKKPNKNKKKKARNLEKELDEIFKHGVGHTPRSLIPEEFLRNEQNMSYGSFPFMELPDYNATDFLANENSTHWAIDST